MARAVLVAGGTGFLGSAVLDVLTSAGYPVTATWVEERERDRVQDALGDRVSLIQADLFDADAVEQVVSSVDDLGAVVNLVGGYHSAGKAHEWDLADYDRMLELNLKPGFLLARAAMPRLVEAGGGVYVGVSARAALRPFAGAVGYITAKAAVLAFVDALHAEYRNDGVRVNAILPSTIDTPANRRSMPDADFDTWVKPDEIARVVRYLCSDDAAVMSGGHIPVYGRA